MEGKGKELTFKCSKWYSIIILALSMSFFLPMKSNGTYGRRGERCVCVGGGGGGGGIEGTVRWREEENGGPKKKGGA